MIEISVIIPTYNRRERLSDCLNALANQTQSAQDYEVIVVVDGSTDGTVEMLKKLATPYHLRVILQENSGQTKALKNGIASANGRICLLIDDDILPEADLLSEHLNLHKKNDNRVGIGYIKMIVPANADLFTKCYAQSWQEHYEELLTGKRTPIWNDCFGGNMSAPKSAMISAGGYPTNVKRGHDTEFAFRLNQNGLEFVFLPKAAAAQHEFKGMVELISDAEESGKGWVKLYQLYPAILPVLLGWFGEAKRNEVLLRRLLLALDIPGAWLVRLNLLFRESYKKYKWNRFIHIYSYWRGAKKALERDAWRRLVARTPILMYHAIGYKDEPANTYILPYPSFKTQMALLHNLGFHVLSLEEYIQFRIENRLPPARSVVLTFDDGYMDNKEQAYPILNHYGFPATIFLVSCRVGAVNDWSDGTELEGRRLMSWSDILELEESGIQFGAHTRTHRMLPCIHVSEMWDEIYGSRLDLEHYLKDPLNVFAYPFGEYNSQTQELVKQAGFVSSCNNDGRNNTAATHLHSLRRTEVFGTTSIFQFLISLL
jgi:glycosyltransferase involved in cell wall biosynthesis